MLQTINRARANPAAEAASLGVDLNEGLSPGTISSDAKQPLAFNLQLISAARSHDAWMVQSQTFAHNEGATDPGNQMRAAGYLFTGTWSWGQNIAWSGQTPQVPAQGPTAAQEERGLFTDTSEPGRGHRLNLLNADFKEIGVGVESAQFQGYNSVLVSQDFALRSGPSFLVGVAYTDAAHTHSYQIGEGLGGVTITATRQGDGAVFSTTTWTAGGYSLALDPGTYAVTASGPGLGGTVTQGNVAIGDQNVEADFTRALPHVTPTTPPAAAGNDLMSGAVFRDRNGDGIRERGEGGLGRWRVYADLNNDGVWESNEPSALSSSRGVFRLSLPPGTYTLREVSRKGFVQTTPAGGAFPVTAVAGQAVTGIQFGHRVAPKSPRHHVKRR
jgi:hypothetical protein